MPAVRLRRTGVRVVALAAAGLLVAMAAAPVGAAPAGGRVSGTGPHVRDVSPLTAGTRPTRVTLITGDTVTYSTDQAGHVAVTVDTRPGRGVVRYRATTENGRYYMIPSDAQALVSAGLLDKELFDLKYLVDNGYGDAKTDQLPVIAQYRQRMAAATLHGKAEALPASTAPLTLASIHSAGVRVDKHHAGAFWKAIVGGGAAAAPGAAVGPVPSRLGAGLGKVWLDAKVKAFDDVSNAQIGAPIAWAAGFDGTGIDVGVIDTGIDANHPDLAGKVEAAQNFVPAGEPGGGDQTDVTDRFGHGTHVASIIAGTGAASGGRYKGVAPGAKLIVAKALSDAGFGSDSTIIAAMQWEAATQHARIVSMSLGGGPTDGTDPLSQAVNDLTAQYGTLFVIAAGNSGPGASTVATPGAAASALTVGAVDSADKLAFFSSRGPRLGDDPAVKPELTAPGWNIIAARAAGTSLGEGSSVPGGGPIDEFYTAASGTSMATPHVAGAVAALVQAHPDWTAEELKAALVGTAHDIGDTVYEQGAGRLDLGRAITQQVFDDTASISAGFTFPAGGQVLSRQVSYRNTGAAPVTLDLTTDLLSSGTPATGIAAVSPPSLTVPAGDTASAQLTIDPSNARSGTYTGRLLATDTTGDQLTVPIGLRIRPPMRTLRVRIDASSQPLHLTTPVNFFPGFVTTVRVNDDDPALVDEPLTDGADFFQWKPTDEPGVFEMTLQLPQGGVYSVYTTASFRDLTDAHWRHWTLARPQVRLDEDATVTFDLKDTVRVDVNTDQPSDLDFMNTGDERITANGVGVYDFGFFPYRDVAPAEFWMLPTDTPTIGSYQAWFNQTRPAAQVTAALSGTRRVDLHPRYTSDRNETPRFAADQHLQLVSDAELRAGGDVRGKLVVADPEPDHRVPLDHPELIRLVSTIELAHSGGAAGVLTDSFYTWAITPSWFPLPVLWVDQAQGAQVRAALAQAVRPPIDIHADLSTPYEYKLVYYLRGRIPGTLTFDPKVSELTRIQTTFHAQYQHLPLQWGPAPDVNEADITFAPGQQLQILASHAFVGGTSRVDYFNPAGPDILWQRTYEFDDRNTGSARLAESDGAFTAATSEREDWNGAILPAQITPGPHLPMNFGIGFLCDSCRQGDRLRVRPAGALGIGYSDASDSSQEFFEAGTEEAHLLQGGTELAPQSDELGLPYYTLPAGTGSYRLTDLFTDGFTGPHSATTVATTWTFQSSRPTTDNVSSPYLCLDSVISGDTDPCAWQPLIYLHYRLGLTAQDTAPAGRSHTFTITAQQGDPDTAATLASLRVWISPDGGKHWTEGHVVPKPDRTYQVVVLNPTLADSPNGTVALRAEARDAAGNSVQQTIMDAYVLT
jgi:subtilisin family serine protease